MTDQHKQPMSDTLRDIADPGWRERESEITKRFMDAAPQAEPVAYGMGDTQLGRGHRLMMVRLDKGQDGCTIPLYTHPAPAADVVRDAERWRVSNMVAESAWTHPDHRTEAESVAFNAYREATGKGLDHEAATDAAVAAIDAAMKGADQ